MQNIFLSWTTARLRGHLIWIPMLAGDDLNAALAQETYFQETRIHQYWDGERVFGRLAAQGLGLNEPIAWDIYLLYYPGTIWSGEKLPIPEFWMHQLDERPDRLLDPARLTAEVQKAIQALLPPGT